MTAFPSTATCRPEIISDMVWYAVDYLDTYGDALAKIILTDVDPQEAYEAL